MLPSAGDDGGHYRAASAPFLKRQSPFDGGRRRAHVPCFRSRQVWRRPAPSVFVPAKLEASLCRLAVLGSQADDGIRSRWNLAGSLQAVRSEEHTSELQSLMRISYAVFCLKKTT